MYTNLKHMCNKHKPWVCLVLRVYLRLDFIYIYIHITSALLLFSANRVYLGGKSRAGTQLAAVLLCCVFCFIRSIVIRILGRCWRTCSFIGCEHKVNKALSDSELFTCIYLKYVVWFQMNELPPVPWFWRTVESCCFACTYNIPLTYISVASLPFFRFSLFWTGQKRSISFILGREIMVFVSARAGPASVYNWATETWWPPPITIG